MRTKWEILVAKRLELAEQIGQISRELEWMEKTPCQKTDWDGNKVFLSCGNCGAEHKTEADFARHYVIPDERLLNLGECPKVGLRKRLYR